MHGAAPFLWLVPALPLAAVLVNLAVGHKLGRRGVGWLACGAVGLSFLAALRAVMLLAARPEAQRALVETAYTWIRVGDLSVDVSFLLDPLSAVMILVVTGVGLLIHVYSIGYMAHDPDVRRFFLYLNLFTFAMLVLVLADNFLFMFVGWEGVGLCSYLLIGFWYQKPEAAAAAKKAFITTRIGDLGFLVAILILFTQTGSFAIGDIAEAIKAGALGGSLLTVTMVLLFAGAVGKSAQFPLHVWLPDAMEGRLRSAP